MGTVDGYAPEADFEYHIQKWILPVHDLSSPIAELNGILESDES